MTNLHVVYQNITELKAYPANARTHSKKQIRQIATSIEKFGFTNPILKDGDGFVIAGHGRLEAAKLLSMTIVPTISLEHMTPEMIRAYRLADNKLAELAKWDPEILKIEFQNLIELDPTLDLTITGFEMAEIDLFVGDKADQGKQEESFDDLLKSEPVSRMGDLWLLGDHRLLCGNALNRDDYAKLMGDALAHLVFTDPPYNVRVKDIGGLGKPQSFIAKYERGERRLDVIELIEIAKHIKADPKKILEKLL